MNQSHLSVPREISVNTSAESASFISLLLSMAWRATLPKAARAEERASTCALPLPLFVLYSAKLERFAIERAVPSTMPPS